MKRQGILHPELCALLAATGHTDLITICDRGFPVPVGPQRIDVALIDDIPTVLDVLRGILSEFTCERVIITKEMSEVSPLHAQEVQTLIGQVPVEVVSHIEFKRLSASARGIVRTADTTPYANIIIVSG